jgi:hypothetical protein
MPWRQPLHQVFFAFDHSHIHILHRVVRFAHGPFAARAVDDGVFHGDVQSFFLGKVTVNRRRTLDQQLSRVVALHSIDIGLHFVGLA